VYQAELEEQDHDGVSAIVESDRLVKTEGERLRTRAVLLCKDERFQRWATRDIAGTQFLEPTEDNARVVLCDMCEIVSRSELALSIPAQAKFRKLLDRYLRETGQAAERRGG
jgi:class 3 adenylate cyclase